jgi:hypothetical protein
MLLAIGCLVPVTAAQDSSAARRAYLEAVVGLSGADVRRIEAGRPIAVTLDGRDGPEVVTFGAVHLRATPAAVIDHIASLKTLHRTAGAHAVGTISTPPQPSDFHALALAADDFDSLPKCRPGSCDLQLPDWAIARFQKEVPSRSPGAQDTANRLVREVAHRILTGYLSGGTAALDPLHDRAQPLRPVDEYIRLLGDDEYLPAPFTALRGYLRGYPKATLAVTKERFFWATIEAHLKPTTRISHMVVVPGSVLGPVPFPIAGVVATTQVWATHYFSSTLEWHMIAADPARADGAYVFFLSRSWTPGMTGIRAPIVRPAVRSRARDAVMRYLALTKTLLEK